MNQTIILSIDDDPEFNRLLKHQLKNYPVELYTSTTPEDFLQKFNDLNPTLCLVDLNIGQYKELGLKLISAIRNKKGESTPIIVISRVQAQEKIAQAMHVGADDYIPKPIDEIVLQSKLERFLNFTGSPKDKIRMGLVPKFDRKMELVVEFKLSKLTEDGLYLNSDNYLAKGTHIGLSSPFFSQLLNKSQLNNLTVSSSKLLPEGQYETFVEFDPEASDELSKIRLWLSEHADEIPKEVKKLPDPQSDSNQN